MLKARARLVTDSTVDYALKVEKAFNEDDLNDLIHQFERIDAHKMIDLSFEDMNIDNNDEGGVAEQSLKKKVVRVSCSLNTLFLRLYMCVSSC